MRLNWKHASMFALVGVLGQQTADAGAFRLRENSSDMGTAFAGAAAGADGSAAVMFNNPASAALLNKSQIAFSAYALATKAEFHNNVASTSNEGGNAGGNFVVPAMYMLWQATQSLNFGVSVTSPFGLGTKYNKNWVGAERAVRSDLQTIDINPSFSYRVNDFFSFGAGVSAQRAEATLSSKPNRNLNTVGEVKGNDWAWGFNAGILVQPWTHTKLGLSYRSRVKHNVKGNITYTDFDAALNNNANVALEGSKIEASMALPDIITFGASHDFNDRWTGLATVEWTKWSNISELRIKYPGSGKNDTVEPFNYKNTWFYALGATYKASKDWKFKFGVAFDQTPTNSLDRSPRLPDENRTWLSGGLEYAVRDDLKFSLDYTFVHQKDAKIALAATTTGKAALNGYVNANTHIIGSRMLWRF